MSYFGEQFSLDFNEKNPDLLTDDEIEQSMVEAGEEDDYNELFLGDEE